MTIQRLISDELRRYKVIGIAYRDGLRWWNVMTIPDNIHHQSQHATLLATAAEGQVTEDEFTEWKSNNSHWLANYKYPKEVIEQ